MSAALLYCLVLVSAIAHSVWNAMVKSAGDRTLVMVAIRTAGLLMGLLALPFVDWPSPDSWKWLGLTAAVQFGYYALLVKSYGAGDMSVVYPLARGLAPVLTTVAAFMFAGEALNTGQLAAVGLISLGIMTLSLGGDVGRRAVGLALATGVAVAIYSFFAGMGVRVAGTILGFQACLEIVTGLGMVTYAFVARRADLVAFARRRGATGLLAGAISVIGFLAYLAAARSLPLGPVTALRETSVIFGAAIGTLFLKEGFGMRRISAAVSVVVGIVLLATLR